MSSLHNKNVLVGVTGGIAAYKSAELVRRLQDIGAKVKVVMSQGAQEFITPLTLQALSGHPVHKDLLDEEAEAGMGHIELARWADAIVVAPATAHFISDLERGAAGNLLLAVCLASRAKMFIAPAMNQAMWSNEATRKNLANLKERNIEILGPDAGVQACGDVGLGRMIEPLTIASLVAEGFASGELAGVRVLISAGPTREAIDPVRYLSNRSSGKMGYALAEAAIEAGAPTTIVSGPVSVAAPERARLISVESAEQMLAECSQAAEHCDIFIAAAAVADYRPDVVSAQKMKKHGGKLQLTLRQNPDIVATIAAKFPKLFVVGFAAETENLLQYAEEKMQRKGLDLIVANDVSNADLGFNSDNNAVTVIGKDGDTQDFSTRKKTVLARELISIIAQKNRLQTSHQ